MLTYFTLNWSKLLFSVLAVIALLTRETNDARILLAVAAAAAVLNTFRTYITYRNEEVRETVWMIGIDLASRAHPDAAPCAMDVISHVYESNGRKSRRNTILDLLSKAEKAGDASPFSAALISAALRLALAWDVRLLDLFVSGNVRAQAMREPLFALRRKIEASPEGRVLWSRMVEGTKDSPPA